MSTTRTDDTIFQYVLLDQIGSYQYLRDPIVWCIIGNLVINSINVKMNKYSVCMYDAYCMYSHEL